jgi:hypothetical protein
MDYSTALESKLFEDLVVFKNFALDNLVPDLRLLGHEILRALSECQIKSVAKLREFTSTEHFAALDAKCYRGRHFLAFSSHCL